MKKLFNILNIVSFLFIYSCAVAQPHGEYTSGNKKAVKYYEAGVKAYEEFDPKTRMRNIKGAMDNFNKAIKTDPDFVEAYLFRSQVYQDLGQVDPAVDDLRKVVELNPNFFPNAFFFIAQLEFSRGHYEEAKSAAEKYISFPRIPADLKARGEYMLENCKFAIDAMKHPVPFNPVNLGPGVNTERPEYFPTLTGDDQMLLFTRDVLDANAVQGGHQEDFFFSIKRGNEWTQARSISSRINTEYNEGAPTLATDGQIIIFTACELGDTDDYGENRNGFGSCDLFFTRKMGREWSVPVNLGEPINSSWWESQPSLAADGKTLYFVRKTRGRDGNFNSDIYMAELNENGEWNRPQRLPDNINTDKTEASVMIHPDGQTLYFSSNGHIGMGGLDIYVSRKLADGKWSDPVNLGYPINTFAEDNSLLVSADGNLAFFASDRPGGFGELDLYSFELPDQFKPQRTTYLKGTVFDSKTKNPLQAKFLLIDLHTGEVVVESYSSRELGEFLVAIATNKDYALNVSRPGYKFYSQNFSFTEKKGQTDPFLIDIPLDPLDAGTATVLENVFFDLDKSTLRPESKIELDKLYDFLMANPKLKVEIAGHTDSRGDKKHNLELSQDRAKSVVDYLVKKGIDPARLVPKGYGDTKPKIPNAQTEEEHQKNRRTEYIIL